ncbi:MAG: class II glutamine amidotransferase [Holdemanella sp.]|nr:class II glutamine amidotransferase [Holdemanella sp.]
MCELFALCANKKVNATPLLKEFYSHASEQPHGWGMATIENGVVSIEKEPVRADESIYLKEKLKEDIIEQTIISHIRRASIGNMIYDNCHPFVCKDKYGRTWTLAHNGTLFYPYDTEQYAFKQTGSTDSERILLYLIDCINRQSHHDLSDSKRIQIVEQVIHDITLENKVNIVIFDGDILYVHTNMKDSLHYLKRDDSIFFSTHPLQGEWNDMPFMKLCAYKNGTMIYEGKNHFHEYIETKEHLLFYLQAEANL